MRDVLRHLRRARLQRSLSLLAGLSALPLAFEIYLEHYKGSFGDKWGVDPARAHTAAPRRRDRRRAAGRRARRPHGAPGHGGPLRAERARRRVLHARGVARKPGGFAEPTYNLVMGPPLLAPGSLALVGGMAMAAGLMRREG